MKKLIIFMAFSLHALILYAQSAIEIVVPFPASAPSSELARQLAPAISAKLGQGVNIVYRPGGNSKVAQEHVRQAKPDGLTYLWATSAILIEPAIEGKSFGEVGKDLAPLALVFRTGLIMVARPGLQQRSFAQVLAHVQAGGKLSCGYGGGAMLLACNALKQINRQGVTLVPYQSSGLAAPDVIGDRLDVAFMLVEPNIKSLIASERMRLLGRTHASESDALIASAPRLDQSLASLSASPWVAWFTPIGAKTEDTQRFTQAAREAMQDPTIARWMQEFGFFPEHLGIADFTRFMQAEFRRHSELVRAVQ
jgi:tripartite-type tricarboxylate transporter receptor subunit TctC